MAESCIVNASVRRVGRDLRGELDEQVSDRVGHDGAQPGLGCSLIAGRCAPYGR